MPHGLKGQQKRRNAENVSGSVEKDRNIRTNARVHM